MAHANRREIGAICAISAALIASACGGGSAEFVPLNNDGSAAIESHDPSSQRHTVGGSISGLDRAGLVLANGGDSVPVAPHTTSFVLPTSLAYAERYAVRVASQPAGLSCSVSNGSGAMPANPVANVKVRCLDGAKTTGPGVRQWTARALLVLVGVARSARSGLE